MNKLSKKVMIEGWFSVDYILFDNDAKEVLNESVFDSYVSAKGAMLSNLRDIYKFLDYEPKSKIVYKNVSELFDYIGDKVDETREDVLDLMKTESSIACIKQEITEMRIDEKDIAEANITRDVVEKRYRCSVVDAILLNDAMSSVEDKHVFESFDFKILIDAHKLLRDSLIDTFMIK